MLDIEKQRIAEKIQFYRKKAKLTQEDLAEKLNLSRTSVTAIEKGERNLKASEILRIAEVLGISVSELKQSSQVDLKNYKIQFRKYISSHAFKEEEEIVLEEFYGYIEKYIELERKIKYSRVSPESIQPFDREKYSLHEGAKTLAEKQRDSLSLGNDPILSMRKLLEQEIGLLVFYFPIEKSGITAGYIFNDDVGGCIFVNKKHSIEKRRFALAHEYAHFLADRRKMSIDEEGESKHAHKIEESDTFANLFASHFLMPDIKVKQMFDHIANSTQKFTELDIAYLAVYFGVSYEAITNKLVSLNLLPKGTYDFMKRNGIKFDSLTRPHKGKSPLHNEENESSATYPYMYQKMVMELYKLEQFSEGQVAYYLGLDRLSVRSLLESESMNSPHYDLLHVNMR
ncbi:MAG: ImmA/IrrE family metallo-endopeptidase [Leptospira sp.]|nr:ImmA/IrrE family metallo-endopeptidase [Leptospira sp.]NCS94359.1 ImmA/IrrE family metallo-endopeptidase [Leptospira sp.]